MIGGAGFLARALPTALAAPGWPTLSANWEYVIVSPYEIFLASFNTAC